MNERFFCVKNMNNERLKIIVPGGELEGHVQQSLQEAGISYEFTRKRLVAPVNGMPIDMVLLRAGSIPQILKDTRSPANVGITGSDILWEAGFKKDAGLEVPVLSIPQKSTEASLYIGMTDAYANSIQKDQGRPANEKDLARKMVITKFPNITQEVFNERNIRDTQILASPGKTEGYQYVYPDCVGIVDVINSGATVRDNGIRVLTKFYTPSTRLVSQEEQMTDREKRILDEVKNNIFRAIERRKPRTTGFL